MTGVQRLKRWLDPLKGTPIHPQWLALRELHTTQTVISREARGIVLDVGCGDRWIERCLGTDSHYIGLDYPSTISKGYPGRPDVLGNGECLPFASSSVDSVVLLDVLEHLPTPNAAMGEVRRVLKLDGVLVLQVPFLYPLHDEPHDFQRWTAHGLRNVLDQNGFTIHSISSHGHPIESAAAMLTLALAKGLLDIGRIRHPALLLAPILLVAIPLINLCGWCLAKMLPKSSIMPMGYRVVAHRTR